MARPKRGEGGLSGKRAKNIRQREDDNNKNPESKEQQERITKERAQSEINYFYNKTLKKEVADGKREASDKQAFAENAEKIRDIILERAQNADFDLEEMDAEIEKVFNELVGASESATAPEFIDPSADPEAALKEYVYRTIEEAGLDPNEMPEAVFEEMEKPSQLGGLIESLQIIPEDNEEDAQKMFENLRNKATAFIENTKLTIPDDIRSVFSQESETDTKETETKVSVEGLFEKLANDAKEKEIEFDTFKDELKSTLLDSAEFLTQEDHETAEKTLNELLSARNYTLKQQMLPAINEANTGPAKNAWERIGGKLMEDLKAELDQQQEKAA